MSRTGTILLRANVVWTTIIWSVFVRNLFNGPARSTGFKVVHLTIATVSVGFAAALWMMTLRNRRQARQG